VTLISMKIGRDNSYLSPPAGRGRIASAIRVRGLALTQRGSNPLKHAGKVAKNVIIPDAQNTISLIGELPVSFGIPPIYGVLTTIDLDNKTALTADEIHRIAPDWLLTHKLEAQHLTRAESVPQKQLGLRRVLPQAACHSGSDVRSAHSKNAPHPARKTRRPLPARGERLASRLAS